MRSLALLLLVLLPAVAAGCSHPHAPLAVDVRDAVNRQPVAAATIRMRPLWLYVPVPEVNDMTVNPNAGPGHAATTDAAGTAIVSAPTDQAFDIVVLVPGSAIQSRTIDVHPATIDGGVTAWLDLLGASNVDEPGPRYEIRLRTPNAPVDAE